MKNFDRDDRRGGGRDSGRRDFGGRGGARPPMHKATCSECGSECEVPFRPTGDRPIFCSSCFEKHNNAGGSTRPQGNFDRRDDKRMFEAVCDKCGNKCEVPFRPTGDKPVYCSQCFDRGGDRGGRNDGAKPDRYKEQFEALNAKLDKILRLMNQPTTPTKLPSEDYIVPIAKKAEKSVAKKVAPAKEKKAVTKKAKSKK